MIRGTYISIMLYVFAILVLYTDNIKVLYKLENDKG